MRMGVCLRTAEVRSVCVHADGRIDSHSIGLGAVPNPSALAAGLEAVLSHHLADAEEAITSVTFDVGAILRRRPARRVFIRIAPRAPVDSVHELPTETLEGEDVETLHVTGGHSTSGEELVPLDIAAVERWCATAPRGAQYVITAVGSPSNDSHERQVGEVLTDLADPDSVQYSHAFHSSSVEVRERTAAVNSSLIPGAEDLLGSLHPVLGRLAPAARLYVTTNDGGCHPLARLAVTPVRSLFTEVSTAMVGAAALAGSRDGFVAVSMGQGTFLGQFVRSAAAVLPRFRTGSGQTLATSVANLVEVTPGGRGIPDSAVHVEEQDLGAHDDYEDPSSAGGGGKRTLLRTGLSLCALGAVVTPLADWAHRVVQGTSEAEVRASVNALESRARARLVSFGAHDSRVEILESGVEASTYDNSDTVTVRVRAISFDSIPLAAEALVERIPVPPGEGPVGDRIERHSLRAEDHASRTR